MNQTLPWDADALWIKSRMFIHRGMDPDREFEEQAFWAVAALELLGKAALVRISPTLIANPEDDGKSILMASGAVEYTGIFGSVQAKAIWSRCARAFRTFNAEEAKKIAAGRNEYIHSSGVGFDAVPPAQWWPKYWAQASILLAHLDEDIEEFVGPRAGEVEEYLAANQEHLKRRLETLLERAKSLLSRHQAGALTSRLEAEWTLFTLPTYRYTEARDCPACKSVGQVGGDEVMESNVEHLGPSNPYTNDPFYDEVSVTLDIAPENFACPTCHLILDEPEMLDEAGLNDLFEAEGDPEDYYDGPEYENE
ncbi:hypothetical protein [Agreia sp. Leaf283]|uniref:hypothetical protein n=1 Tax=Agreia sp. Leaf283 TaxID=1736321 RepID=UPI000A722996|nr:hypothetical protein [Agreia sp. Leaf283]